jgi:hypothetical protein
MARDRDARSTEITPHATVAGLRAGREPTREHCASRGAASGALGEDARAGSVNVGSNGGGGGGQARELAAHRRERGLHVKPATDGLGRHVDGVSAS